MAYWEEFDLLSSEEVFDVTASDVTRLAVKEAVGGKNVCVVVADSCTSSQMFECLTTAPEVLFNTQLGRFETVTDGTGFIEIAVSRDRNTPNGSFGVAYVIDKKGTTKKILQSHCFHLQEISGFSHTGFGVCDLLGRADSFPAHSNKHPVIILL